MNKGLCGYRIATDRARRSLRQLMKRRDVLVIDGQIVEKETDAILARMNGRELELTTE